MRQIGTLKTSDEAERFVAYLVTQEIASEAEADGDVFAIWIKNEDQLPDAKAALAEFIASPNDPRYRDVQAQAEAKRREERARRASAQKNVVEMRGQWQRPGGAGASFRQAPLTFVLIGLTIYVGYLTNVASDRTYPAHEYLNFCRIVINPETGRFSVPLDAAGEIDGYQQIRQGQLWRLVTPIFIHYGWLHLIFNMLWLYSLGGRIERKYGAWRLGLLILAVAIISNVCQYSWEHSPRFGGMSGVNYGLFGFLWMRSIFFPKTGLELNNQTVFVLMFWLVLCMLGNMSPFDEMLGDTAKVANTAHVVGLVVGMAIGAAPLLWQKAD